MAARLQHARRWLAGVAGASLIVSGLAVPAASAAPAPAAPDEGAEKVRAQVQEQLENKGSTDFWVRFADRPDLSEFASIADWDERGTAVYRALSSTATDSQGDVRAQLDEDGVDYRSFFVTNAIKVSGGDAELVDSLAASGEVEGIYPSFAVEAPDPKQAEPRNGPNAVEWGIADIKADQVWEDFGVRGEGIVVANIDSGVQYDHPALVEHYRGNNGDGTFDHSYNWFDAAGTSPDEPADDNGHGTHTMGTMIGDDGGENQVGVAPGATWIAANGCCPSDAALIASGEWMLAPTDLDGENPMPSKRPHIINNSWGSQQPSNDPFMEDVIQAWEAAGQFGMFANGNSGALGCESSGSPGSRTAIYSVGNYQEDHTISATSGRGPGQDGELKPNVSAPGTAVRSTVPGSDYAYFSGTSMASPHAAGAVALAWSAAPGLIGDVAGTRALLDGSAIDTEDLECGGTAEDNNVFGEGRLDALALLTDAPVGETGTLEGTVTDAADDAPLEGAEVAVVGPLERTVVTDEDGAYTTRLTAGDYDATVSAFGYGTQSATVSVTAGETATLDVALDAVESATVSGTVTDGSGHGWPMYAAVTAQDTPVRTYTDPETGAYSMQLPVGGSYTVQVVAQYAGYETTTQELAVNGDMTWDVDLVVDAQACSAPGYGFAIDGTTETFDGSTAPEGWSVVDAAGSGDVWAFDDPGERGNLTGGEGGFAVADSDFYGSGGDLDTSLVSPSVDMSDLTEPVVGFRQDLNYLVSESMAVDVSVDGGSTWENLVTWQEDLRGPREDVLPLPMAAGEADVQVRFHLYDSSYDWWWEIDDVFLGNRACVPDEEGGLVVGNVYDGNTGDGVTGASVTDTATEQTATTTATPDDENLADGFYWMFAAPGAHELEASARSYSPQTQQATVPADDAARTDFTLGAGQVEVDPEAIETEVVLGEQDSAELTVSNTGTGAVDVELREVPGDFVLQRADGSRMTGQEVAGVDGAPEIRLDTETSMAASGEALAPDAAADAARGITEEPWTDLPVLPENRMDARAVNLDGEWYLIGGGDGTSSSDEVLRYDAEAMTWTEVEPLPEARTAVSAAVMDGSIVVTGGWVDAGVSASTVVYDAAADSWTSVADNPQPRSAAGHGVVDGQLYVVGGCTTSDCLPTSDSVTAYDPGSDSWSEVAPYPQALAFVSCGGVDGELVCTGGNDGSVATDASYVYDASADSWSEVTAAPTDLWAAQVASANGTLIVNGGVQAGAVTNATMAYDPAADVWSELPNSNTATYRGAGVCGFGRVGGSVGGFNATDAVGLLPGYDECGGGDADVPWLALSQVETTLAPDESWTVEVTTDSATVQQPGTYDAAVRVVSDAPGAAPEVPVTMTVLPPTTWGKLLGQVDGESCEGAADPLAGAGVDIAPYREDYPGWSLTTDEQGDYALWYDTRVGESEVTAFLAGYRPESADVRVPRGAEVTQDFALLDVECDPGTSPVHPEVLRHQGEDRYGTAGAVSELYEPGVSTVYVATGETYPDALAAAARAGSEGGPILLTDDREVPPATSAELVRLEAQEVIVLGGKASVPRTIYREIDRLTGDTPIDRVGGDTRYDTAAMIAEAFEPGDVDTVYIASGETYPDALAAAARAGSEDVPVLLVEEDEVPDATADELARLEPSSIVVLGGYATIEDDVDTMLGQYGVVERIYGDDRYGTAVALSETLPTSEAAFVASGQTWPDALAGAARAGHEDAPVLLVKLGEVPDLTWEELGRLQPGTVHLLGGEATVNGDVEDRLGTLE